MGEKKLETPRVLCTAREINYCIFQIIFFFTIIQLKIFKIYFLTGYVKYKFKIMCSCHFILIEFFPFQNLLLRAYKLIFLKGCIWLRDKMFGMELFKKKIHSHLMFSANKIWPTY